MASKAFIERFARQLPLPTKGLFGWLAFNFMKRKNIGLEKAVVRLSAIQPDHNVLELGFGPGYGLMYAHKYIKDGPGKVYGVDLSSYMVEKASLLVQKPIQEGKVELILGDVMHLPFEPDTFHRVFHCNCYYFWPSLQDASREIYRVMKPGGMMVTGINLQGVQDIKAKGLLKYGDIDHVRYMRALEEVGFQNVRMEEHSLKSVKFQTILAHLPLTKQAVNGRLEEAK